MRRKSASTLRHRTPRRRQNVNVEKNNHTHKSSCFRLQTLSLTVTYVFRGVCEVSWNNLAHLQVNPPYTRMWSRTETGFQTDSDCPKQPRLAPALWPWFLTGLTAKNTRKRRENTPESNRMTRECECRVAALVSRSFLRVHSDFNTDHRSDRISIVFIPWAVRSVASFRNVWTVTQNERESDKCVLTTKSATESS